MGFSFEDIEQIWIEEKSTRGPTDLPDEFYQNVAGYVAELSREASRGDLLRRELIQEELRHVLQAVQEIHLLRVLKTAELAAKGELPGLLLERERYAFNEIKQAMERLYAELIAPAMSGKAEIVTPREITNIALIYLEEVPQIIGENMKCYGPFRGGEVGFLPKRSAELLIKRGVARKIEVKVS